MIGARLWVPPPPLIRGYTRRWRAGRRNVGTWREGASCEQFWAALMRLMSEIKDRPDRPPLGLLLPPGVKAPPIGIPYLRPGLTPGPEQLSLGSAAISPSVGASGLGPIGPRNQLTMVHLKQTDPHCSVMKNTCKKRDVLDGWTESLLRMEKPRWRPSWEGRLPSSQVTGSRLAKAM